MKNLLNIFRPDADALASQITLNAIIIGLALLFGLIDVFAIYATLAALYFHTVGRVKKLNRTGDFILKNRR